MRWSSRRGWLHSRHCRSIGWRMRMRVWLCLSKMKRKCRGSSLLRRLRIGSGRHRWRTGNCLLKTMSCRRLKMTRLHGFKSRWETWLRIGMRYLGVLELSKGNCRQSSKISSWQISKSKRSRISWSPLARTRWNKLIRGQSVQISSGVILAQLIQTCNRGCSKTETKSSSQFLSWQGDLRASLFCLTVAKQTVGTVLRRIIEWLRASKLLDLTWHVMMV